jgi:hypothetical protein
MDYNCLYHDLSKEEYSNFNLGDLFSKIGSSVGSASGKVAEVGKGIDGKKAVGTGAAIIGVLGSLVGGKQRSKQAEAEAERAAAEAEASKAASEAAAASKVKVAMIATGGLVLVGGIVALVIARKRRG